MAIRYWDGTNGNDANDGLTMATAWKSTTGVAPAAWLAAASAGDIAYRQGTFRPTYGVAATFHNLGWTWTLTNRTSVQIINYDATIIRGDTVNLPGAWLNVSGNTWEKALNTGLYIDGVTWNYDTETVAGKGGRTFRKGQLRYNATPTAAWDWNYTTGTGLLRIVTDGTDPNTVTIGIVRGRNAASPYDTNPITSTGTSPYQGDTLASCTGCAINASLTQYWLINPYSTADGYAIICQGGDGNYTTGGLGENTGYHGAGCAGNGSNVNHTFVGFNSGSLYKASTNFIAFAGGASTQVNGVRFLNCVAHVQVHLAMDGNAIQSATNMTGFYCHTNGLSNNLVNGILFERCTAYMYGDDANRNPFGFNNLPSYAGNWDSTVGRNAICRECVCIDAVQVSLYDSVWFDRCRFDYQRCGPAGASNNGAILLRKTTGIVHNPLFTSCEFRFNSDRSGGFGYNLHTFTGTFDAGDGVGFIGCSLIDTGTNSNDCYFISYEGKTNYTYRMYGCAIGFTSKPVGNCYLCVSDNALGASAHEFRTNAYLGFSPTLARYSSNTSFDTKTEWIASIDTGTGAQAPAFVESSMSAQFYRITESCELASNSTLRRRFLNPSYKPVRGITGNYYGGDYGAYQYPQSEQAQRNAGRARLARGR
ncbi:MAG: hypothetical protein KGR25_00125 [Chloroflexi bacterium]|nr:hypothetical protein [Chloroflexota bacterium]